MKPPESVYVAGRSVPFDMVLGTRGKPFMNSWGEADSTGAAVIDSGQAGHIVTLALHELCHVILAYAAVTPLLQAASENADEAKAREEHVCDTFASWVFMVLRDNPNSWTGWPNCCGRPGPT